MDVISNKGSTKDWQLFLATNLLKHKHVRLYLPPHIPIGAVEAYVGWLSEMAVWGVATVNVVSLISDISAAAFRAGKSLMHNVHDASCVRKVDCLKLSEKLRLDRTTGVHHLGYANDELINHLGPVVAATKAKMNACRLVPKGSVLITNFNPIPELKDMLTIGVVGVVYSISAASLIAKEAHWKECDRIHKFYPEYKFDENSGIPTPEQFKVIKELGMTPYHRPKYCMEFDQLSSFFMRRGGITLYKKNTRQEKPE